ncbi:pilus assembly protein PilO [Fredinandcohnia sp. 179-A 10B2 NHS]|uniref:pilus assembly protein PilO n=1 Tax=Fredinandcohnia sp. 179-A 10B2 NHS TaxID=3235176 RepID=UPI0039A254B6
MTLRFTRKQVLILVLTLTILVGGFYLWYYVIVKPVEARVEQQERTLVMEQKLLDTVLSKKQTSSAPVVSSTEIQKKIPVIPLVEQLLLELERAETVSKSKIISMSYSENALTLDSQTDAAQQQDPNATTETSTSESTEGTENAATETNQQTETTEATTGEPIVISELEPELVNGLKQITVSLTVESPSYYELEKFLSVVEHQTRITKVDSLTITGRPELTMIEQEPTPLVYAVTISTFYMPAFAELAEDAPKIKAPEPSKKRNPLTIGLDKEKEEEKKSE